jgi:hypothetical protein
MPAPLDFRPVGRLLGSWPIAGIPSATPTLQPDSLISNATILSTRQATAGGFAVGSMSFYLWRDEAGVPTQRQVNFPAGGPYTLAQVIGFINGTAGITPDVVARNANNFLELRSPYTGETSYLRLQAIAGSEEVFNLLGLAAETISRAGDLRQAQHVDPSRQIAGPGQLGMAVGENFSAAVLNRLAAQLGVNVDRVAGQTEERKFGVRREEVIVYNAAAGLQLGLGAPDDGIYTGPVATPTTAQLRDTIIILDSNGNEFVREAQDVLNGPTANFTASIEADTERQLINSPTIAFNAGDVDDSIYVLFTNIGVGNGDALNNIPLKVIEFISMTQVIVSNIDPTTGDRVNITGAGLSGRRMRISVVRAEVEGLYREQGLATRVEQVQEAVAGASGAVTRVEGNNRIEVNNATFLANARQGDLVVWTGMGAAVPFANNGTYRIRRVIDNEHLELVDQNYGPVILNPDSSLGLGSVVVRQDGDFYRTPYVGFAQPTSVNLAAGRGAVPANGETIRVIYLAAQRMRTAAPSMLEPSVRFSQEVPFSVQRALMRLAGPSVTSFDQLLHGENWQSLEKVDFRVDREHHESGRHATIRPDVINMFPNVAGVTHTIRAAAADAATQTKLQFVSSGGIRRLDMPARGTFDVISEGAPATPWSLGAGNSVRFRRTTGSLDFGLEMASNGVDVHLLKLNVFDNNAAGSVANVLAIDAAGRIGVNMGTSGALPGQPQANFHVRARNNTDQELVRIEGFDDSNQTVALSFKPRRGSPYLSFVEVDFDTNDWFMNFVLTAEMDTQSTGAIGVGTFRWVLGGATEAARLNTSGLQLSNVNLLSRLQSVFGAGLLGTDPNLATPRHVFPMSSIVHGGPMGIMRVATSNAFWSGFELNFEPSGDTGAEFETLYGATRNPATGATEHTLPGVSAMSRNYVTADGAGFGWQTFGDTAPFTGWNQVLDFSLSSTPDTALSTMQFINGIVRLTQGATPAGNVAWNANVFPNTIYPKSFAKAWARVTLTGTVGDVTIAVADGIGFDSVTYDVAANSGLRLQVDLDEDFANTNYAVKVMVMGSSPVTWSSATFFRFNTTVIDADQFYVEYLSAGAPVDWVTAIGNGNVVELLIEVYGTQLG